MKRLFLVNPKSGVRRKLDLAAILDGEGEIVTCGRKEDLESIVDRAEREAFDVVYAVGGDGTVHEVAKRLIGRAPALGILPTGSGNGYARHLGLPLEPRASIDACRSGAIVTVDTALVNDSPFLGVLGVGLDAVIAHRFASSSVRGLRTYVKEGLKAVTQYRPEDYEITVDGERLQRRAYVVAVANSSQYGNNARIAPVASLQDGLLDVVIVEDLSFASLIRLFRGTLHLSRRVHVVQGREIVIRRGSAGAAHLDGEPVDLPAELRIRVVPMSLRLLVPAATARI